MSAENFTDVIVETSTRVVILEERFERHFNEVKADFKSIMSEIKEMSKTLRDHENNEAHKHFNMNDRVSKLESDRGVLAKAVNAILATITGGLAGWLARHS